jgi:hypothetical protein
MRGAAFAIATMFVAIAGCGLATSGLFDPSGTGSTPDGSPSVIPIVDSAGPAPGDEAGASNGDAGGDAGMSLGGEDAGSDAPNVSAVDAACVPSNDPAAIATVTGWPNPPPPKIDGDLSDWPCDGRVDLTDTNAAYVKNSAHPLEALVEARWDKQNIYIAIHVRDSNLDGGAGDDLVNPYNNDSVEVYVSADATLDGDYDALSHQYITDWKGLIVDYGPSHDGDPPDTAHAHFTAATMTAADGWNFEASLGWQALYTGGSNSFAAGTNLALDFEVNDGNGTSQVAALILTMAPAQASCTCLQTGCCCGQNPDVPYCDSGRIGRVTLQ